MYVRADVRGVNMPDSTNDSFEITAEQIQEILKKENMRQRKRASKRKRPLAGDAKEEQPTSWERKTDG